MHCLIFEAGNTGFSGRGFRYQRLDDMPEQHRRRVYLTPSKACQDGFIQSCMDLLGTILVRCCAFRQ